MGVDFRGKGYVRFVRLGKRRVKEGEAVAVWNQYGKHTEIIGPQLVRLFWATIRFLEHHVAESDQYLRVKKRDGTVQHIRGPSELFENPVYHLNVTVENAIVLADNSAHIIVLSKGLEGSGEASTNRKTVVGPTTFFPEPTDIVHTFKWTDKGAGTLSDDLRVLNMQALIVRTLKCNVRDSSENSAVVSVELRARLTGIDGALAVADPIAECDTLVQTAVLQALTGVHFSQKGSSLVANVRAAVTTASFGEELRQSLRKHASCELLSFSVVDVKASEALERLFRKEDELAAAKVTEQLAVISLDAAMDRQEREQKLQAAKQEHELTLEVERETAKRKREELNDQRRLAFLKELRGMNVDLTRYLCTTARAGHDAGQIDDTVVAAKGWWCS